MMYASYKEVLITLDDYVTRGLTAAVIVFTLTLFRWPNQHGQFAEIIGWARAY